MHVLARSCSLVVLLLGLLSATGAGQQSVTSSIQGVVSDAVTKEPLSGVAVEGEVPAGVSFQDLYFRRVPIPRAVTGKEGVFLLENLPPGRTSLQFVKPGYRASSVPISLIADQKPMRIEVSLSPLGIISGRLTTPGGQPAVNVGVTAWRFRFDGSERELVSILTSGGTNDLGEFRLPDLAPGRYYISFSSSGSPTEQLDAVAIPRPGFVLPTPIDPLLYPGVGDLSRAEVIEVKSGEVTRLRDVVTGTSRFGEIRLSIVNGTGAVVKDAEFSFGYGTYGVAYDGSGGSGGQYPPWETMNLEERGEFTRTYRPSRLGIFIVDVRWKDPNGQAWHQRSPIDFSGLNVEKRLVLSKPDGRIDIHGVREQRDGKLIPLAGATIGLCKGERSVCSRSELWIGELQTRARTAGERRPLTLGSTGNISLSGLEKGEYHVYSITHQTTVTGPQDWYVASVVQDGRNVLTDGLIVSERSSVLEVLLRSNPPSIEGIVVDPSGRAVENALVALLPASPLDTSRLTNLSRIVRSDKNGSFRIEGVMPGSYQALISLRPEAFFDESPLEKMRPTAMSINVGKESIMGLRLTVTD